MYYFFLIVNLKKGVHICAFPRFRGFLFKLVIAECSPPWPGISSVRSRRVQRITVRSRKDRTLSRSIQLIKDTERSVSTSGGLFFITREAQRYPLTPCHASYKPITSGNIDPGTPVQLHPLRNFSLDHLIWIQSIAMETWMWDADMEKKRSICQGLMITDPGLNFFQWLSPFSRIKVSTLTLIRNL